MNVLIVTSPQHEDFVYRCIGEVDYRDGLTFVINNKHDYEKFTASYSYDIGISFMWTHKISKKELDRATWFNFHPAPLPEYKGRNLCYHAILNGETEFGATLHYMDENFDTGDIIEVGTFVIEKEWNAGDLSAAAVAVSKGLFMNYLPRILAGERFTRYPNKGGTYYKKTAISEKVVLKPDEPFSQFVRAVTFKDFHPKIEIGGVTYKIVRDE